LFARIRRLLLGRPLPTARQAHERLPKFLALPVFASDAVSSVAYATQEILIVLMAAGSLAWAVSLPIAGAIAILIGIVAISYRQTIFAYPSGGGSYTVAKENLGDNFGLIAAASLLTDYILTVSVSVSAGVAAIVSLDAHLAPYITSMGVIAVLFVAFINLRGVRESGALFAPPTYLFIISLTALIVVGLVKVLTGHVTHVVAQPNPWALDFFRAEGHPIDKIATPPGMLFLFFVLRAFSSGCSALTGIEAIANGIPAFRAPESKNAATTMTWMASILAVLVLGITYLAHAFHVFPAEHETVISLLARTVFGAGPIWYTIQIATAAILILAANTAFQDFPRLAYILAGDRFAPRQLRNRGDKLAFSNGILMLALVAALLIVIFRGDTNRLIPLYAVGVFISFTLSQLGMGVRQTRLKAKGWRPRAALSFFGGTVTGIVALVVATTKFVHGAFIVIILIPLLVWIFYRIHAHYIQLGKRLRLDEEDFEEPERVKSTAIVLVSSIHKGIIPALEYARNLSDDCRALYIETDEVESAMLRERWPKFGLGIPLVILESPYRTVIDRLFQYIDGAQAERRDRTITVVLPEFVIGKWWHRMLHNQSSLMIKLALMTRRDIVVTNVRYFVDEQEISEASKRRP
jgi:amino acid transporter